MVFCVCFKKVKLITFCFIVFTQNGHPLVSSTIHYIDFYLFVSNMCLTHVSRRFIYYDYLKKKRSHASPS